MDAILQLAADTERAMIGPIVSRPRRSAAVGRTIPLFALFMATGCGPFFLWPEEQSPECMGAQLVNANVQGTVTLAIPGAPLETTSVAELTSDAGVSPSALSVYVTLESDGNDGFDDISANVGTELDSVWFNMTVASGSGSYSLESAGGLFFACPCTAGDDGGTDCPSTVDDAGGGTICADSSSYPITGTLDIRSASASDFKATLTLSATDNMGSSLTATLSLTYTGGPPAPLPGCGQDD